jgi:hypothetical protein
LKTPAVLVLLLALASGTAAATELTPFLSDQRLGVVIKAIELPATFPKDLVSGLTNKLLIRVALVSGSDVVEQKTAEVAVKYDLWDETFGVTLTVNEARVVSLTCTTVQEVEAYFTHMKLPGLFAQGAVPAGASVTLRVEMLLNPIERERIETIRKWVAENSTYTPSDITGYGGDKRVGSSRSNAIFNRIFDEYAQGSDLAATWKEAVSSRPFNLSELGNDR